MFTRGTMYHPYYVLPAVPMMSRPGDIRVEEVKGIAQTWAISRPLSGPHPNGAPLYIDDNHQNYPMIRGGQFAISPSRPRVEADLTNPSTWQRKYVLTGV